MTRPRVFVTRDLPGQALASLRQSVDVEVWPGDGPPPAADLARHAEGADGLLSMLTDRIDSALLDTAPSVRIVSNMAVGYDNVDVAAATARGVLVTNTPGVLTETVADLTFALILASARRIIEGDRVVRQGGWRAWHPSFLLGRDIHGATLGIVGLGQIGLAVARRARGFGMRLIYTSRQRKPEAESTLGLTWASLDDLLRAADFVSLHVALTAETRGLIGRRKLALMKPTALLVNTARGGIVVQADLIEALKSRRIGGAALDVAAVEPVPPDDALLKLDNLLMTPHVGSATVETRSRMASLAAENLLAFFAGERPPACVNPEVLGV